MEQVEARFGPANSSMTAAIKKCLASGGLLSGMVGPHCLSIPAVVVLQLGSTLQLGTIWSCIACTTAPACDLQAFAVTGRPPLSALRGSPWAQLHVR